MEEITGEEFYELLQSKDNNEIMNYIVEIENEILIDIDNITEINHIINCKFNGKIQFFHSKLIENPDIELRLTFTKCIFEDIVISKCYFDELKFINVTSSGNIFSIDQCQIYRFLIENSEIENEIVIFHHNTIINQFSLRILETKKGNFYLRKNKFPLNQNNFTYTCLITQCQLFNCDIADNDFGNHLFFTSNILTTPSRTSYSINNFRNCTFELASFYETDFGESTNFSQCSFNGITKFDEIKNDITTNLKFTDCNFKSPTSFRKAKIHSINFDHSTFENSTFFQDTYFDKIKLDNSIFEKNAFFDNVQIKQIYDCDRRTIRNIKLHLQKTENKIDYNKFRVYEFEAYKTDLKKQITEYGKDKDHFYHRKREIKNLKRDLFILNVTGFFSDYGTDWKRALKCTLLFGLLLYIPFFISENWSHSWDLSKWQVFPIGFLRFFILTDFYSPLKDGKSYIDMDHLLSWFIFIFGKIVIAFGIYEMIQAFRKFKA